MAREAYYYKVDDSGTLYEFDKNKNFIPSEDVVFLWKGEGWDDSSLSAYDNSSGGASSSKKSASSEKRSELRSQYEHNVQKAEQELRQYQQQLAEQTQEQYRDAYVDLRKSQSRVGDFASAAGMRGGAETQRRAELLQAYENALAKIQREQARLLAKATQSRDDKISDYKYSYNRALDSL